MLCYWPKKNIYPLKTNLPATYKAIFKIISKDSILTYFCLDINQFADHVVSKIQLNKRLNKRHCINLTVS